MIFLVPFCYFGFGMDSFLWTWWPIIGITTASGVVQIGVHRVELEKGMDFFTSPHGSMRFTMVFMIVDIGGSI